MDKSQVTLEFVTVLSVSVIVFIILSGILSSYISDVRRESETKALSEVVESVQIELSTAKRVSDGYSRQFEIPEKIYGKEYNITLIGDELVGEIRNIEIVKFVPETIGSLKKGKNRVYRYDGMIIIE